MAQIEGILLTRISAHPIFVMFCTAQLHMPQDIQFVLIL